MVFIIREFIAKYTRRIFKPTLTIEPLTITPREKRVNESMAEYEQSVVAEISKAFGLSADSFK